MTFDTIGVEVTLPTPDDFLKIRETLTRIGIASRKDRKLYQSCHILHKKGNYRILHFKELFLLDGKQTNFSDEDISRRNTIANLLAQWKLVSLVTPFTETTLLAPISQVKIIPFKDKDNWDLIPKYNIGRPKYAENTQS